MDYSDRNRKVALARWKNKLQLDKANIPNDDASLRIKAGLCGLLAGDGSVQIRKGKTFSHYQVDFFPDDKEMLRTYCHAIRKIYGKNPSIKIRDNVFNVRLSSRVIVEDLKKYSEFGINKWNLPYSLFLIKGAKEAWLRGFFSAEGYVGGKAIKIQTINREGMLKVSKLLLELGIAHGVYEYIPKNKNYSKVTIITINKKEARRLFYDKIGFWHTRKSEKLRKALAL